MLYRIDLGQVAQRRIEVALDIDVGEHPVTGSTGSGPAEIELFQPAWTPGSYLVREYARHVSRVAAADASGVARPVRKTAKNRWAVDVSGVTGSLCVRWSVYAHDLTVRTAYACDDKAFWNGANTLLWPCGAEERSAGFEVALPEGWRLHAGSQDVAADGSQASFRCGDLDEAVDTPCLAGPMDAWSFDLGGVEHRFVAAGLAGVEPPDTFLEDVRATVTSAADVFGGELPFARYTFLALFSDEGRGGLEHRDSSTLLAPRTTFRPRVAYEDFLALVAHEYLHAWNVKRMRPQELWRIDLERENHTRLLWVAEGFTAYYDDLIVRRAGLSKPAAYLERLAAHVQSLRANPGRFVQSLGDASFDAWILLYRADENTRNATQNYYTNGALAALAVDSEIRRCSGGARSLDDALRLLWTATFDADRGYTIQDVVQCVGEAAGRSLSEFVHALVEGPFDPDLERALGLYGLRVEDGGDESAFLGVRFRAGTTILASVEESAPGWRAGLCPGDELLAANGLRVTSSSWQSVWDHVARPECATPLLVARRGRVQEIVVVPESRSSAAPRIVSLEEPTESQLAHRESWLGTRTL